MVGFEDLKGLSEAELYKALTDLANTRTNAFGFTEAGQSIYDLAEGLKFKILTKEDIVGSEETKGMVEDFVEEIKDDGIAPEVINKVLVDKFKVGKKYEIDKYGKGKYVDDNEPQDFESYLMKPKEEVKPEVKEDFTEKVLMAKLQDKINDLEQKYPELLGKEKAIDDAIELKKELEKEIIEVKKEGNKEYTKKDAEDFVKDLFKELGKKDDFVNDPALKNYKDVKDKLFVSLSETLYKMIHGE